MNGFKGKGQTSQNWSIKFTQENIVGRRSEVNFVSQ